VHNKEICYGLADCDSCGWTIASNGWIFKEDCDYMGFSNGETFLIRGVIIVLSRGTLGHTRTLDYILDHSTVPNEGQYSRRLILQLWAG
jgi:hypothetical protein